MLTYNKPEDSLKRQRTKRLSLEQEVKVVKILNDKLTGGYQIGISKADEKLLQRFLNHYQNMSHYLSSSEGLYCTDRKELANHKDFFQLKF